MTVSIIYLQLCMITSVTNSIGTSIEDATTGLKTIILTVSLLSILSVMFTAAVLCLFCMKGALNNRKTEALDELMDKVSKKQKSKETACKEPV